jgi:hypothetical protein
MTGFPPKGVARRKTQTYGSAILEGPRRAPCGAPHAHLQMRSSRPEAGSASPNGACYLQRLFSTGPRFPLPAMAGRSASSWQGLPNGPGGSPDAARVPACEPARRRRPSSRLANARAKRPSEGRGRRSLMQGWRGEDKFWRTASQAALRRSISCSKAKHSCCASSSGRQRVICGKMVR